MAAHPLDGCRAKLDRANKHFGDLIQEENRFRALDPYGITPQYNPQTRELRFRQRLSHSPDLVVWGTLIGDCVHNLRCAFDHLAWQLVVANGGKPSRYTEFPAYIGDPLDYESSTLRKVQGMAPGAVTLIEHLQPYRAGSEFDRQSLYMLNALDIEDKHHFLVVACAAAIMPQLKLLGTVTVKRFVVGTRIIPLIDGAETPTAITFAYDPTVEVHYQFAFYVAFDEGGPGQGEPVIPTLSQLIGFTEQTIELFRPFL